MAGKIKESNTRTALTIDRDFKKKLEELAQKEHRSFNGLVISALYEYVENQKRQG